MVAHWNPLLYSIDTWNMIRRKMARQYFPPVLYLLPVRVLFRESFILAHNFHSVFASIALPLVFIDEGLTFCHSNCVAVATRLFLRHKSSAPVFAPCLPSRHHGTISGPPAADTKTPWLIYFTIITRPARSKATGTILTRVRGTDFAGNKRGR